MADFEKSRKGPAIATNNFGYVYKLAFKLSEDPNEAVPSVQTGRTLLNNVQALARLPFDRLRITQQSVTAADREKWRHLEKEYAFKGKQLVLIRDLGYGFLLPGWTEDARDVRFNQKPFLASTFSFAHHTGRHNKGSIGVFDGDPTGYSRTALNEDGDCLNGVNGWTAVQPAALLMANDTWLQPHEDLSAIRFAADQNGNIARSAYIAFDTAGVTVGDTPYITASFLARADYPRLVSGLEYGGLRLRDNVAGVEMVHATKLMATPYWAWYSYTFDISAWTGVGDDLRLYFDFDDVAGNQPIRVAPWYISMLQIEARAWATPFTVYSTPANRNLTGSRSEQRLAYINYVEAFQQSAVSFAGTVGTTENPPAEITIAFDIKKSWLNAAPPQARVVFVSATNVYHSNTEFPFEFYYDTAPATNVIGVKIPLVRQTSVNTAALLTIEDADDLSEDETHLLFTWQDANVASGATGYYALYKNGNKILEATHQHVAAPLGHFLYIGSTPEGEDLANAMFSNVAVDPCVVTVSGRITIDDYYNPYDTEVTDGMSAFRNGWKGRLDGQKGQLVKLNGNNYALDARFAEEAW